MSGASRILVVEDDNDINQMITALMMKNGYQVVRAYSGTEAVMHLGQGKYDLVLLDLMLPGLTGEQVLEQIRKKYNMPVIVISAKIDKLSKIALLKQGADDYITKPFDLDELEARIQANLRRYHHHEVQEETKLSYKDIILDQETKEVFVQGKQIILTAREYRILALLMHHPHKVFSRGNLFESVWEEPYMRDDNTINVHMSKLRCKLQQVNPHENYIETIWGMGYKLN